MLASASIALSGMRAAETHLHSSAHNIANLGTEGFRRQQVVQASEPSGGVGAVLVQTREPGNAIETDVVGLLQAKNSLLSNLAVFRTGERMLGALLDLSS